MKLLKNSEPNTNVFDEKIKVHIAQAKIGNPRIENDKNVTYY